MALLHVNFSSRVLDVASSMDVVLPEPSQYVDGSTSSAHAGAANFELARDETARSEVPVLYLLHGLSDDHSIWIRRTSVERYAAAYGLALIMPAVGRSYYADMATGAKYWSFISEELPSLVRHYFNVSSDPERTFVAGLSMGGYGALRLGLTFPDRFAAIGSFSGAVDPEGFIQDSRDSEDPVMQNRIQEFNWMFGDPPEISGTGRDLFGLARQYSDERRTDVPPIYMACGSEDFLIEHNRAFKAHLDALGIETEYREEPGVHEWGFWDRHIRLYLEWLHQQGLLPKPS